MEPLVLWLEHHPRSQWQSQAVRDAWNATHPARPDTDWRSALAQAYNRERVVNALGYAGDTTTVGQALYGVLSFGAAAVIRVLYYGTDVTGHRVQGQADVAMRRGEEVSSIKEKMQEGVDLMTPGDSPKGIQIDQIVFLPGSYRLD